MACRSAVGGAGSNVSGIPAIVAIVLLIQGVGGPISYAARKKRVRSLQAFAPLKEQVIEQYA